MAVSLDLYKEALGFFASGVTVVTTECKDGDGYGLTVSSFTSVSLDPRLVLVCLDQGLSGLHHFEKGTNLGVSILSGSQTKLSEYFATTGTDRTAACGHYVRGEGSGCFVLRECLVAMECKLIEIWPAGDHRVLLAEVQHISRGRAEANPEPLVYFRGKYCELLS